VSVAARRKSRRWTAACALLSLACTCALAPAALAAGSLNNELAEKVQQQEAETPATTATTNPSSSSESGGGTSTKTLVIVVAAAGAVLGTIAFVIVRDARKVAPVTEGGLGDAGTSRRAEAQLRRRRARAKAARQQRKRNR